MPEARPRTRTGAKALRSPRSLATTTPTIGTVAIMSPAKPLETRVSAWPSNTHGPAISSRPNATTHGQRDLDDDRLSNLIEAISTKRLGLDDVEADIIGKYVLAFVSKAKPAEGLTWEKLAETGFL